jgi:hypothetical protein
MDIDIGAVQRYYLVVAISPSHRHGHDVRMNVVWRSCPSAVK